jgi:DNA-binding NarL/FixJ family response regulator
MDRPAKKRSKDTPKTVPPLPLDASHWRAIFAVLDLSPQQAKVVELTLRGLCDKQIAAALGITEPTLRTYMSRISVRTRTRGRMELAMHILGVSHQVSGDSAT